MNGLATYNVVMISLLALVAAGVLGTFLAAVLWELFGDLLATVWSFLERAFWDIVEGFKNAVEWLVYGVVAR